MEERQYCISARQLQRMIILETGSVGCLFVTFWSGGNNGLPIVMLSVIGSLFLWWTSDGDRKGGRRLPGNDGAKYVRVLMADSLVYLYRAVCNTRGMDSGIYGRTDS